MEYHHIKMESQVKAMKENVRGYKEYALKYLPQYDHLWEYEVPEFDKDAYEGDDELCKLEMYKKEVGSYLHRLRQSAHLRQLHYEEFIEGKMEEDPAHAAWRIGMNNIVEEGEQTLEYWTKHSDNLLDRHIKRFERKRLREQECAVDMDAVNVEYESKPKQKSKRVKFPKISKAEKNARRRAKIKRLKAKSKHDDKIINIAIRENEQQKEDHDSRFQYITVDPMQILNELKQIFSEQLPGDKTVPCLQPLDEKSKDPFYVVTLKDTPLDKYKQLGYIYAGLFVKKKINKFRIREIGFLARSDGFLYYFIEALAFYCYTSKMPFPDIILLIHGPGVNKFAIHDLIMSIPLSMILRNMDHLLMRAEDNPNIDFDTYADIADMLKANIVCAWADARVMLRTFKMREILDMCKGGYRKMALYRWSCLKHLMPGLKTAEVYHEVYHRSIHVSDWAKILHKHASDELKKCIGRSF
jgi:hypothetical protein